MGRTSYRRYDWRVRNLFANSQNIDLFPELGIPRSTRQQWIKKGPIKVVTLPELDLSCDDLQLELSSLKSRLKVSEAESTLISRTIRLFGFEIQYKRLPSSLSKTDVLETIRTAALTVPIGRCLDLIGMSVARFQSWTKRSVGCQLADQPSCPRSVPSRLTTNEMSEIKSMLSDQKWMHLSVLSLSLLGKRLGTVFASASTWSRLAKAWGIRRGRRRIYPQKPKIGIRASAANQIWHLDMSIIRLQDNTRVFVQAVIENFSRYVLAWHTSLDFGGLRTKVLLDRALTRAKELGYRNIPEVMVDSGCENINRHVEELVTTGQLTRTIAQIDVVYSNSMIEMLFHRLKNRHLYFLPLHNFESVVKAVDFYMSESNERIPHAALGGAYPLEVISGSWSEQSGQILKEQIAQSKKERVQVNRGLQCEPCLA